jgi:hypothetical protein
MKQQAIDTPHNQAFYPQNGMNKQDQQMISV